MKSYKLNTNVYQEYLTSRHDKLLIEQNDLKVAVCTDCHGVHNILSQKNPASSTYKLNIPKTCAKCHADKEYMKQYNIPTDQYSEYIEGIHGGILLGKIEGKNSFLVPTCVDCHGAHGATPPEIGTVHQICGTCHFDVLRYFKSGSHFDALKASGSPKCIDCHGNHKNTLPQEGLLISSVKGSCGFCHKKEQEPKVFELASSIQKLIVETDNKISELKTISRDVSISNRKEIMDMVQNDIKKLNGYFSNLRKISHSLDINLIEGEYKEITTIFNSTKIFKDKFLSKEKEWSRGFMVTLIGIFLGILFLLSWFFAKGVLKILKTKRGAN